VAEWAEWIGRVGIALLAVGLAARWGIGLYAIVTHPSLTIFSSEGLDTLLMGIS
jgi:hypothetical protein